MAGGAGRRLGRTKGDLVLDGAALALRAARLLAPLCAGVLVSVRPGDANPAPGYPAIEDAPPAGRGPLAGIAAAFCATTDADLLVLACDYPLVETELLRGLVGGRDEAHDLVLVRDPQGRDHPLLAVWRRGMQQAVREALENEQLRVTDLVATSRVLRLGSEAFPGLDLERALLNVNRPNDLRRI